MIYHEMLKYQAERNWANDVHELRSKSRVNRYVQFNGPIFPRNSLKIAIRICHFSQYLGTKLEKLFEIAKSVEIYGSAFWSK